MKAGIIFIAIVAVVGAIAYTVAGGDFTTLVSSITGPSADRAQKTVSSAAPARQPEVKQPGAIEPPPAPRTAELPAPTPPAPVANDSTSGAKTAPADILVPDAATGTRTALTAAEKEAVARGLKELGLAAANATASSPSEQAATAELNRKGLADRAAEEARAKQVQAQSQQQATQQYEEQKRVWEKQQADYLAQLKGAKSNP